MSRHILEGKLVEIGEEQSWPSGFAKVLAIVAEGGSDRDPDQIPVEFTRSPKGGNDSIELLQRCDLGDTVRVAYELRGREWQGKHFLNLSATNLERIASATPQAETPTPELPGVPAPPPVPQGPAPDLPPKPEDYNPALDELPF